MDTLVRTFAALVVLFGVPGSSAASNEDVARFLRMIADRESGGDCTETSTTSTAIGCYQMTDAALKAAGFKDDDGWVPNEYGITSDEEFLQNPAANYAAMLAYTLDNWRILRCEAKARICDVFGDPPAAFQLDAAGLLAGAHILGARGMRLFLNENSCNMGAHCLLDSAVEANGGDRERLRRIVVGRIAEVVSAGLDVSELTQEANCGGVPVSCVGGTPD